MAEYERAVRAELTANGCTFVRHGKGAASALEKSLNQFIVDSEEAEIDRNGKEKPV